LTAPNCARITVVEVFAPRTVDVFAATATRDVVVGIVIIVIIVCVVVVCGDARGETEAWRGV